MGGLNKGHLFSENEWFSFWSVSHTSSVALNLYMLRSPFLLLHLFLFFLLSQLLAGRQKDHKMWYDKCHENSRSSYDT